MVDCSDESLSVSFAEFYPGSIVVAVVLVLLRLKGQAEITRRIKQAKRGNRMVSKVDGLKADTCRIWEWTMLVEGHGGTYAKGRKGLVCNAWAGAWLEMRLGLEEWI